MLLLALAAIPLAYVLADEQAPEEVAVESAEATTAEAASMEANNLVEEMAASTDSTEL